MSSNLVLDVRHISSSVAIVDITGDLNGAGEQPLMDAYTQANAGATKAIILNFTDLDYMNSSGIGLLVTLLIRVQRQRQKLLAYGLSAHYLQIFELTRLNEAIGIYPDEAAALTAVSAIA